MGTLGRCPRCRGALYSDRGDLFCFSCGEITQPRVVAVDFRIRKPAPDTPRAGVPWTPLEEEYIAIHFGFLTASELAEALGRSERGLWEFFRYHGYRSPTRRRRELPIGELLTAADFTLAIVNATQSLQEE